LVPQALAVRLAMHTPAAEQQPVQLLGEQLPVMPASTAPTPASPPVMPPVQTAAPVADEHEVQVWPTTQRPAVHFTSAEGEGWHTWLPSAHGGHAPPPDAVVKSQKVPVDESVQPETPGQGTEAHLPDTHAKTLSAFSQAMSSVGAQASPAFLPPHATRPNTSAHPATLEKNRMPKPCRDQTNAAPSIAGLRSTGVPGPVFLSLRHHNLSASVTME